MTAAALIMKSLTDTLICSEKTKKKSLSHKWCELVISETCNCSHIHQTWSGYIWSESGRFRAVCRRLAELCRCLSSYPFVQHQTVMNAASGIIHDLTVKSFRSWTMRVRQNNRRERIPRYTQHLSNGSGMAVPFPPSQRRDWKDLLVV